MFLAGCASAATRMGCAGRRFLVRAVACGSNEVVDLRGAAIGLRAARSVRVCPPAPSAAVTRQPKRGRRVKGWRRRTSPSKLLRMIEFATLWSFTACRLRVWDQMVIMSCNWMSLLATGHHDDMVVSTTGVREGWQNTHCADSCQPSREHSWSIRSDRRRELRSILFLLFACTVYIMRCLSGGGSEIALQGTTTVTP